MSHFYLNAKGLFFSQKRHNGSIHTLKYAKLAAKQSPLFTDVVLNAPTETLSRPESVEIETKTRPRLKLSKNKTK